MCTVTFVPKTTGYYLDMNRDEQLSRVGGLPPRMRFLPDQRRTIGPSEPSGGTWICLNDHGVSFALINWHSIDLVVKGRATSRGEVINAMLTSREPRSVDAALKSRSLERFNPFRLIAVFPKVREVFEFRWDLDRLSRRRFGWEHRQWVSSGFDERRARAVRGRIHRAALQWKGAGGLGWLRRLHASHLPEAGPFSICMHREDAATVSSTLISVARSGAVMWHQAGNPCQRGKRSKHHLSLEV